MTTPANRAKIRLVRGTYANILASIADLVDGELCYAKDRNKLYMVEGTALTSLDYLGLGDVNEAVQDAVGSSLSGGTGLTLTYDDVVNTLVIDLDNTAVTAGVYGSSTAIPVITIDQQGRITGANTAAISTDLSIAADGSTTDTISIGSETLTFTGGTGLTSSVAAGVVTFNLDNTTVTAGTYGSSSAIPTITVDAQGRITSVSTNSITTSLSVAGDTGSGTIELASETFTVSGGTGLSSSLVDNAVTLNLDNTTVTTGTYGDSNSVGSFTVDAQGRLTAASNVDISVAHTAISDFDAAVRETTGIDQTFEPMGHAVRTDSIIAFNTATRTFSIRPASTSYDVWCKGVKYTKTAVETVTIPNTTGLYYVYFNASGQLSYRTSYFDWDDDVPTAYIYWNATTGTAPYLADERHGIALDWATHEYLHRTRGAVIANGFSLSNYTTVGDGSLDAHAQIDLSGGTFFDEDLEVQIVHSNTPTANTWEQDLQGPARIPVLYLDGTAWVRDAATNFPLKQGTTRPQYNLYNSGTGTWSTVDASSNRFIVSFICATHNLNAPVIAVLGQNQYTNIGDAEGVAFSDLTLTDFPSVEFRPLYKLVFECNSYANTPKARLRAVIDIRQLQAASVGQALGSDHGILSGLGDDDHLQYLHATNTRTGVTANIETSGTLKTTSATSSTSSTTGALVVTGGVGIGGDLNIGGNLTVSGDTVTINTETIVVEDKNIQLGTVTTPTNTTADGGGITLLGATSKTITWLNSTSSWTFSENIDIASGKDYKIAGTSVLTATALGSSVTSSSLTSVGTITTGVWNGTVIATSYGGTGQSAYTNGQILIGKNDGSLAKTTLTAGTNVLVQNGDGSITISSTDTTYTAGTGLTLVGTTFSHSDTSNADNLAATARTYVSGLTFDTFGHVTGYTTGTETVVDTTYSAGDGLDLTATTFSLDLKANGGLVIENTELALDLGATSITGTLAVADGGTGITSAAKGSVLVANTLDTLTALDGGGTANKFLYYNATNDTVSWETEIDGGTF